MSTIELTPTEVPVWRAVPEGGTFWLVRDGVEDDLDQFIREENLPVKRGPLHPPAEFVQACAPCEPCHDERAVALCSECGHPVASLGTICANCGRGARFAAPCPSCRIELVGPTTEHVTHLADGRWHDDCLACHDRRRNGGFGTVPLGHAYAVGQPLQTDDGKWTVELRRA